MEKRPSALPSAQSGDGDPRLGQMSMGVKLVPKMWELHKPHNLTAVTGTWGREVSCVMVVEFMQVQRDSGDGFSLADAGVAQETSGCNINRRSHIILIVPGGGMYSGLDYDMCGSKRRGKLAKLLQVQLLW